jgi:hypothetical protein
LFIYLEREIPPSDCLFDVITRNQAIEEFKIVVRRLHGMLTVPYSQLEITRIKYSIECNRSNK